MTELITIEKPDVTALMSEYEPLVADAEALVVNTVESHGLALEGYKYLKQAIKKIKEHYEPTRKALDTAKKEILRARDTMTEPFEKAMSIVNSKVNKYEDEEKRKWAEEAKRLAEEEKKRQEDARIAEAEAAEKAGDQELAEEIIERPIETVTTTLATPESIAQVKGVSTRVKYSAAVWDLKALVAFAANSYGGECYLQPNMPKLNELARLHKGNLSIPGVRLVSETVRTVR